MKTKRLLQTTGLTLMIMLLTTLITNAQIPIQGLAIDHEGAACWDADGSGPELEAYGHTHPYGWGSSLYYCASRDYVDSDPNAAMCHLIDNIVGFPLFVQALADNDFTAGQVKIKTGLLVQKNDIEGEDWFTLNDHHYYNRYDAYYNIELDDELMIQAYINNLFISKPSTGSIWYTKTNFSSPLDISGNSSLEVQAVAEAFLADVDDQELRLLLNVSSENSFGGNGRVNGTYFSVVSGSLEKGLPEIPFIGLAADHEGLAGWDADGTGPEPEAYGHTFNYGGFTYWMAYYTSSRDYDDIDPDPNAAFSHFLDDATGFPNLEIQLEYLGLTMDQLKTKCGISTLGNNIQGDDWDLDGSIHWWNHYGTPITIEIAGEPILEYVIDTNFSSSDLDLPSEVWESYTTYSTIRDVSANASSDAQHVAASFLKDLGGHSMKSAMEGYYVGDITPANGRVQGAYHTITSGSFLPKLPEGRLIWGHEIKDTLFFDQSPYIIMDYCEVSDGETLVIEPGVVVKFNTTEMFMINGCIVAEGTEENPILFTALDNSVRWGGMGWDQTPATNASSKLKHCIFEYAYAYNHENLQGYNSGGAISVNDYENIEISNCLFRYNFADEPGDPGPSGGAILLYESSLHISHCIFHDNQAGHGGAITLSSNSNAVIDNCLFYDNEATDWYGGAILTYTDCSPFFINCTFADNFAINGGGAVELELGGTATFTNCIFWGNTADIGADQISIWIEDPPSLNVYYCDIEDGMNGIEPGFTGEYLYNLEENPEFMGPGEEYPYGLSGSSPCINYGTLDPLYLPAGWTCPAYCLCGNARVYGDAIDLGSYESLITGYNEYENRGTTSIHVFPNPINSNPVIEFHLDNESPVQISIMDIHGKTVTEINVTDLQKGQNRLTLSTDEISAGLYFCVLKTNEGIQTTKMIKL